MQMGIKGEASQRPRSDQERARERGREGGREGGSEGARVAKTTTTVGNGGEIGRCSHSGPSPREYGTWRLLCTTHMQLLITVGNTHDVSSWWKSTGRDFSTRGSG